MSVAIVVLSHNGWSVSEKFLNAIYDNTELDSFVLKFIDNGSSDETPRNLEKYAETVPNMSVVKNKYNRGVIGGRNQGFDWYIKDGSNQHDYLMFLDNDQFVKEGWLEQHISVLKMGYNLVGVEAWQLNRSSIPVQKNTNKAQWFSYVGCGGMVMEKEVPKQLGGFDDRFNPSYFEDPDYCYRALDTGFKIGWNYKAKIIHVPHQTLGKAKDKQLRFTRSLAKFQQKWNKKLPPMLYQLAIED